MYKSPPAEAARQPVLATLLPVMTAVLAGFSIIGVALPVLPLYVNNDLGFGPFMIGLVAG
ncbi:TPA: arabinose transporter, partial [Burkholderia vietnamiensis]|nr:arabinose transporter [Burkholderia vietnamiensis]